jgi:hypothetical protein
MSITMDDIAKYGVMPLLIVAIIWMNNRLNEVERRLYDCMEKRIERTTEQPIKREIKYAILPKKQRYVLI